MSSDSGDEAAILAGAGPAARDPRSPDDLRLVLLTSGGEDISWVR